MKDKEQSLDLLPIEAKELIQAHPKGTPRLIQRVLRLSFLVWIISIIVFVGSTILFKAGSGGLYSQFQSLVFIISVVVGGLSFLIFMFSLFVSFFKRIKILSLLRRFFSKGLIFTLALLAVLGVLVVILIQTTPDRAPAGVEQKILCKRTEMYKMPPEFQRALSLIIQRYVQKGDKNADFYQKILNCIDVQFTDIHQYSGNTEGYFVFDAENSSLDKLTVYVDASYTNYDDLTTALLLSHELTHVKQFVEETTEGKKLSCVDQEVEAFKQQLFFSNYLNEEENKSVIARAEKAGNNNPQLQQLVLLIDFSYSAAVTVNGGRTPQVNKTYSEEENQEFEALLTSKVRQMVISIPGYQEQCDL